MERGVFEPFRRRETEEQGHSFRDNFSDRRDDFKQQAGAVFKGAAVGICSAVGDWGEELMDEILQRQTH